MFLQRTDVPKIEIQQNMTGINKVKHMSTVSMFTLLHYKYTVGLLTQMNLDYCFNMMNHPAAGNTYAL